MKNNFYRLLIGVLFAASCKSLQKTVSKDDGKITVHFVQVNDVYEIAPLNGGTEGGMARVASIKKKYLQQNPNTFLIMAGDFLSPSVYNSLQYEGQAIRGKQMVAAMNAAGMDLAIFGNHEFDIKETELLQRINESNFQWIASNTFHKRNDTVVPFAKTNPGNSANPFPATYIKTVTDADGTVATIGFIGITLPFNKAAYVSYTDPLATAKTLYKQIKDSVDAVVAITHQSIEEDEILAKEIPGLAVIIGGHEHDQYFEKTGNVYITKALANARSAYILALTIDPKNKTVKVDPTLELLNLDVTLDSATNRVVQHWATIANNSYAALGFNATAVVLQSGEPLDGRETAIRSRATNFTKMVVAAVTKAAPGADVVIVNAGSIRVDDILHMPVTQYDILRSLPYGGSIKEIKINGALLLQILEAGLKNKNTGGFLHHNEGLHRNVTSGTWLLNDVAIDSIKTYRVALNDFLLSGGEANLHFLNPGNKDIVIVNDAGAANAAMRSDIRQAIVSYLNSSH